MTDVDAVVVGAGVNGLVAAITLAEAGWRVVVLEAADRPGGAMRTEELTLPGFRHDVGATVLALARASPAFRGLGLERDGMQLVDPPHPLGHALAPGRSVHLERSVIATAESLGRDGSAWERLVGRLARRWKGVAASVLDPTALPPHSVPDLIAFGVRGVWPATTVNRRALRTEPARALFSGLAAHSELDLREPISAGIGAMLGALAHGVGWPVARGGSGTVVDALVRRLTALGGEVRTGHRVRSLGELPTSRAVMLDLTPRQILALAGDRMPASYARRLTRWRYGPGVFKVDWALDAPVPWTDPRLSDAGTVHVGGSAADVVASEHAVTRGAIAPRPFVLAVQASAADPTRAPAGKHTLWAYCHVPHGYPRDMTSVIEARIEQFAPGFRDRILARHAMGPSALEAFDANLVGGDIGGGLTDVRQLAARPSLSLRPWATPVSGLYVCSSSALPGGGTHGMSGFNAARTVLARHG